MGVVESVTYPCIHSFTENGQKRDRKKKKKKKEGDVQIGKTEKRVEKRIRIDQTIKLNFPNEAISHRFEMQHLSSFHFRIIMGLTNLMFMIGR